MHRLNRRVEWICLLLGVFWAPTTAAAQEAVVSGTVTDTTGFVLPGVTVEASDAAGDQTGTAVTDGAGMFTITLTPGSYELTFTLPGFQQAVRRGVQVGAGATVTLDVELAVELEERVVVVGSRAQPRSVTESQVPIDAIPFQDVASQGPHHPGLPTADPGSLLQRRHASDQRRGHAGAAGQHPQLGPRPHPGAGQRQAPSPLVGHRLVRRCNGRLAGAGHLDHPDHRLAAGRGAARRRVGAVRVGRDRRRAQFSAQGQPGGRQLRAEHRHLPGRRRRRLQRGRQRRVAARDQRLRQPQPGVRQRGSDQPQRAAGRRGGAHRGRQHRRGRSRADLGQSGPSRTT